VSRLLPRHLPMDRANVQNMGSRTSSIFVFLKMGEVGGGVFSPDIIPQHSPGGRGVNTQPVGWVERFPRNPTSFPWLWGYK